MANYELRIRFKVGGSNQPIKFSFPVGILLGLQHQLVKNMINLYQTEEHKVKFPVFVRR